MIDNNKNKNTRKIWPSHHLHSFKNFFHRRFAAEKIYRAANSAAERRTNLANTNIGRKGLGVVETNKQAKQKKSLSSYITVIVQNSQHFVSACIPFNYLVIYSCVVNPNKDSINSQEKSQK